MAWPPALVMESATALLLAVRIVRQLVCFVHVHVHVHVDVDVDEPGDEGKGAAV
jgi:hypothetical protein